MKFLIVIPARFGSTRFPGKPLALINGKPMIDHVYDLAVAGSKTVKDVRVIVATDDERIENHCKGRGMEVLQTSENCRTGSDRVLEAAIKLSNEPDVVINLQGDTPLTPKAAIEGIIHTFASQPDTQVATPVKQLNWEELARLRRNKKLNPFTGTTVVMDKDDRALWFSKTVLPAMRKEEELMENSPLSPVYQHLGLYGYRLDSLRRFVNLKEGYYEKLEGLEQLRFLENNIQIQCVPLSADTIIHSGIDSPEDVQSAESVLRRMQGV